MFFFSFQKLFPFFNSGEKTQQKDNCYPLVFDKKKKEKQQTNSKMRNTLHPFIQTDPKIVHILQSKFDIVKLYTYCVISIPNALNIHENTFPISNIKRFWFEMMITHCENMQKLNPKNFNHFKHTNLLYYNPVCCIDVRHIEITLILLCTIGASHNSI